MGDGGGGFWRQRRTISNRYVCARSVEGRRSGNDDKGEETVDNGKRCCAGIGERDTVEVLMESNRATEKKGRRNLTSEVSLFRQRAETTQGRMGLRGVRGRSKGGEATISGEFPLGLSRSDDEERSRRQGGGGERCRRSGGDAAATRRSGGTKNNVRTQ